MLSNCAQRPRTQRSSGCNGDQEHDNRIGKTIQMCLGELDIAHRCHTLLPGIDPTLAVDRGAPASASPLSSERSVGRCTDVRHAVFPCPRGQPTPITERLFQGLCEIDCAACALAVRHLRALACVCSRVGRPSQVHANFRTPAGICSFASLRCSTMRETRSCTLGLTT